MGDWGRWGRELGSEIERRERVWGKDWTRGSIIQNTLVFVNVDQTHILYIFFCFPNSDITCLISLTCNKIPKMHALLSYITNIVGIYSLKLYFLIFAIKYHVSPKISVQTFTENKETYAGNIAF